MKVSFRLGFSYLIFLMPDKGSFGSNYIFIALCVNPEKEKSHVISCSERAGKSNSFGFPYLPRMEINSPPVGQLVGISLCILQKWSFLIESSILCSF